MSALREYLELFFVFFRIGAVTFGGGIAMLPILERDLVVKRGWMTASQLVDYFAIGQCTPGIIAVNVATFVGYERKGVIGSIVTTAAIVMPSLIIITLIAMFLSNFMDIAWVQKALKGVNVVVAVLLISSVWSVGKKTVTGWIAFGIAFAAFVAMVAFNVSGVIIVFASAALGLAFKFRPGKPVDSAGPAGMEE
jgi:chromate transporter